jgi:uncharacterized protein YegL
MKTLNHYIVLDRSGSMQSNWVETLGSINGYVSALKNTDELNHAITLIAFDSTNPFEVLRDTVTLEGWNDITNDEVSPRGMTPLYTAVVNTLERAEENDFEKVVVVIMTDGQDTGNVEHTRDSAKAKIEVATNRGWEVIFLGANFDASHYTKSFGLGSGKFVNTNNMTRGATMSLMASKATAYASGVCGQSVDFSVEEQTAAEQEPGGITKKDNTSN